VSTLAIELSDAALLAKVDASTARGEPFVSPGYALVDGHTLLTGVEAADNARLKPRLVNNRFWGELDTTPLGRPFGGDLSHADLAHAHLSTVWSHVKSGVDSVILAVPGSHSDHQLGLILGIARACGIPVDGMVDAAVAAARRPREERNLLHLDLQLHAVVLTELTQGRERVRRRVQVSEHTGLIALQDAWAKRIARTFVHHTRFDPLHVATTEQELYRRLPELLGRLCREERASLEMEAGGRVHTIEVGRRNLLDAVEEPYDGVVQLVRLLKRAGQPVSLLLSHRAAGLPGLEARFAEVGEMRVVALPADAAVQGALNDKDAIRSRGEALPFVTRLPLEEVAREPASPGAGEREARGFSPHRERPTHILHQGRAYAVTDEPFVLGVEIPEGSRGVVLTGDTAGISRSHCSVFRSGGRVLVEDHSSHGSFLNGQRIECRAELSVGDRLRVGAPGIEVESIAVTEDDGAAQD